MLWFPFYRWETEALSGSVLCPKSLRQKGTELGHIVLESLHPHLLFLLERLGGRAWGRSSCLLGTSHHLWCLHTRDSRCLTRPHPRLFLSNSV